MSETLNESSTTLKISL
jgi:predicted Zn-dependent protease